MHHFSAIPPSLPFEKAIDDYLDMRRKVPMSPGMSSGPDPGSRSPYGYAPRNRRRRRAAFLTPNSEESYGQYADSLKLFFTGQQLATIHLGNLRQYQEARLSGAEPFIRYRRPQDAKEKKLKDGTIVPAKGKTSCPAKAKKVNQELGLLQMLMKHAGAWTPGWTSTMRCWMRMRKRCRAR